MECPSLLKRLELGAAGHPIRRRGRPQVPSYIRRACFGAFPFLLWALTVAGPARADWWESLKDGVAYNYDQSKRAFLEGQWDFYLPLYTLHAPWVYSAGQRAQLNDRPWGLGIGRTVVDDQGHTQGLYTMAFQDSHFKPMYIVGYDWMAYWPLAGRLEGGVGYTLFLFSRSDVASYAPIPGILPLVSVRYRKAELYSTYVPGFGRGAGNATFFFARFNF